MGQDFAQEREWSEARELDWFLLGEPLNKGMKEYVSSLLKLYREYPALYEIDNSWDGFEWVNADDGDRSTYSFIRKDHTGKNSILVVLNFTPVARDDFRVGVPDVKKVKLLLNSDEAKFGGQGHQIDKEIIVEKIPCDYREQSISFSLPAYGAMMFLIP